MKDSISAQELSIVQKIFLFLGILGVILWLGGSMVRASIAFDLFVPGTLDFKTYLPDDAIRQTIRLFANASFYTMIGYGTALPILTISFFGARGFWKKEGWILVAGILFLLYIPVEAVQVYFDIRLIQTVGAGLGFPLAEAKALLLKRLSILAGAPLLAMFSYCTAILFLVWRPLRRRSG